MKFATYFNPTDIPVVIDDEGHSVPGQSWGPAPTDSPQVVSAIESGRLVEVEVPTKSHGGEINPEAAAALAATEGLNKQSPASAPATTTPPAEPEE